jgi:hypothetical protein
VPVERLHDASGMSPLEFMQRLASLVPGPRLHLIRLGGCITSLREMSVPPSRAGCWPQTPNCGPKWCPGHARSLLKERHCQRMRHAALGRPMRVGRAKLTKRVSSYDITCKQVSRR